MPVTMNLSYWEQKSWLKNVDFTIVGSGIVGLHCALHLRARFPKATILILEKGMLPQGASTKNAGFACFGSLSELIDDLKTHSEQAVVQLVQKRIDGLRLLRKGLGDKAIDYKPWGGYELFNVADTALYDTCMSRRLEVNNLLKPLFNAPVFTLKNNTYNFKNIRDQYSFNAFEGQLDTGKMMTALLRKAHLKHINILNQVTVTQFEATAQQVHVQTDAFAFKTAHLFIATNGFASQLLEVPVEPARAQVLITQPIKNLAIKGTFHVDRGYYYFRNIDNRILLGGGRNLDFKGEQTTVLEQTRLIQDKLTSLLRTTILPQHDVAIDHCWSGIMGVGASKNPVVKQVDDRVYCGVRLGGMGVAIGSLVGKELADLLP